MRRNRLDIFIHQPVNNARATRRVRDGEHEAQLRAEMERLGKEWEAAMKRADKTGNYGEARAKKEKYLAAVKKYKEDKNKVSDVTGRHHPETGGVKTPINDAVRLILDADTTAYKGYLIKVNPMNGYIAISKGGSHISSAKSVEEAKKIIDELV